MDNGGLIGSEIHGFHTLQDLDVANIMKEASTRWLRPNEIQAILCNHHYFTIHVKPANLPESGTIMLFDRKMLRNFRKDGHNWKKKNDGKTVKEAHEHLKVGNEERIHVYYAHGQDNPTFARRCYWLLDKRLEHIVLVHYRETQELQGSPATQVNSNSSTVSDPSTPWVLPEGLDSGAGDAYHAVLGPSDGLSVRSHEQKIHEINTLDWDELVASDPNDLSTTTVDEVANFDHHIQASLSGSTNNGSQFSIDNKPAELSPFDSLSEALCQSNNVNINYTNNVCFQTIEDPVNSEVQSVESITVKPVHSFDIVANDALHSQDSFGRWMNSIMADSPSPVDNVVLESPISSSQASFSSALIDNQQALIPDIIFKVTDISPAWAFSTEETKILITGYFHEEYLHLANSDLLCVCGDACIRTEIVQIGVYRCLVPPHAPGLVNLFMSTDGNQPISQVLKFEYRAHQSHDPAIPSPDKSVNEVFQVQMRLAHLLFSTSKCIDIACNKMSPAVLKEAKKFAQKASSDVSNNWSYLINSFHYSKTSVAHAKDVLFELTMKNKLMEWLLERIIGGCKTTEHDAQGQGVIHLCAISGYTWAVRLFSWSGLSLDFRDKHGWTALHWAAYCGREKMVAALLSAGAKPYLVTDPTSENTSGCTAGDLASKQGYDGLGAYLSENSLVEHLKQIVISGNASDSVQSTTETEKESENLPEDELCLKDTLAAYRTAADAAARIQAAFRAQSFKLRSKVVESSSPEIEARNIIAAMKIQHAFRNYDTRKKMAAAVRIQYKFRTWKMRQEFLTMRRHAIRIQAIFRGFQVRRQYRKIIWSVGVLEKVILRWRLRRKGFRGLNVDPAKDDTPERQQSDTEEDFFRASRKQAEKRVERSVVRVQAMFRSKKAQEEYRRMKLAHTQAKLEYGEVLDPSECMDI